MVTVSILTIARDDFMSENRIKENRIGKLSPQEALEYIFYTHAVEGIVLTESERNAFLKDVSNGDCEESSLRILDKYREVAV